jgi:hypothetical protein
MMLRKNRSAAAIAKTNREREIVFCPYRYGYILSGYMISSVYGDSSSPLSPEDESTKPRLTQEEYYGNSIISTP